MVARLTDAEVRTLIPILKAETEGYAKQENGMMMEQDKRYQLFLDIQSGKTDPLNWLKQYSKHIIIPPGATYQPACSREVSLMNKLLLQEPDAILKPSAVPTAIFTYGKEYKLSDATYKNLREGQNTPDYQEIEKIKVVVKNADSFYTKNGFSTSYGMSTGSALTFNHPEDEGRITGSVFIWDWIIEDPQNPEINKLCGLPNIGPVLEFKAEYALLDEIFAGTDISTSINDNTRSSLKKAGISEERYALVKASLLKARIDSEYPDGIEVPTLDFTPNTQEEKEMMKIVEDMRHDALARKSNINVYNKFKLELDPILDRMPQNIY
ncbi:MAG TPA: hypothetical protein VMV47_16080 [Bacteroidales bacterium]|nr:hypothetical protein [Bacteroidales bacterium]